MKLNEILRFEKKLTIKSYANKQEQKFFEKKGYSWEFNADSVNKNLLRNNYEKDCVVAYLDSDFVVFLIIKTQQGQKGFVCLKKELDCLVNFQTYRINPTYVENIFKVLESDNRSIIVESEIYNQIKRNMLMEKL